MQTVSAVELPPLRPAWRQLVAQRGPLAFALDFDGTLVPRPIDPAQTVTPPAIVAALARLAEHHPVAIVTGRDAADVAERVGLPELYYAGCHGMELSGPDLELAVPREHAETIERAGATLVERFTGQGAVIVERKRYAVSVHVRRVPESERGAVRRAVQDAVADVRGLVLTAGDAIVEVRADAPRDKGTAVQTLRSHFDAQRGGSHGMVFVGDDLTDEDALRVVATDPRGVGVLVGRPDRTTHAAYALDDLDEVAAWLAEASITQL